VTKQDKDLDEVSIIDFILNGVVTYPHTMFTNLLQIEPATEHCILNYPIKLKSTNYWIPIEEAKYSSIKVAADDLRNCLQAYVNKIITETTNVAQFISGGEDSRVVSALLKRNKRSAYIFLDQMNREGKT